MKLGLIQTKQNELYDFSNPHLHLNIDRVKELQKEMQAQALNLMKEACGENCDFIVTSEAINFCGQEKSIDCDYTEVVPFLEDSYFKEIGELARSAKAYILVSAYNQRNGKMYNSVLVYNKEGERIQIYDKVHLVGSEKDRLTPGEDYVVLDTEYGKIGMAICWDLQFPEVCRELVLQGAELIVCPTWGWEQIYGHARAYENGIYVAGAMSVPYREDILGIRSPSEVVTPTGEVIASGSRKTAQVVTCELDIRDCKEYRELRISERHPDTYRRIALSKY